VRTNTRDLTSKTKFKEFLKQNVIMRGKIKIIDLNDCQIN